MAIAAEQVAARGAAEGTAGRAAAPRAVALAPPRARPRSRGRSVGVRVNLGGLSNPQMVILTTWLVAIGLRAVKDMRKGSAFYDSKSCRITNRSPGGWPCPGPYWKMSALYLTLMVGSTFMPNGAAWLALGFTMAYFGREANCAYANHERMFGLGNPLS